MRLTRSVTLDLPTDLLDPFEAAAIAKGISLNQAVEAAIKTHRRNTTQHQNERTGPWRTRSTDQAERADGSTRSLDTADDNAHAHASRRR